MITMGRNITPDTDAGRRTDTAARSKALAELRQAIWEASQHMSTNVLDVYCRAVFNEIEADAE